METNWRLNEKIMIPETVIQKIESVTGYSVNARLRSYIENFPFGDNSRMVSRDWVLTPQDIVREIERFVLKGHAGYDWPIHILPIGSNDNPRLLLH